VKVVTEAVEYIISGALVGAREPYLNEVLFLFLKKFTILFNKANKRNKL